MLYTEESARAAVRNREGKRVFYLGNGDRLTAAARAFLERENIAILPAEAARPERYRLLSGGYTEEKPEHLTHLNGDVLVPKTHPRIAFRGAVDTLEAELLLCGPICGPARRAQVAEVLDAVRLLLRHEVLDEPVPARTLCGLSEAELRRRSHFPQEFYGQPHFMPAVTDSPALWQLTRARGAARAAELAAAAAFTDRDGRPQREDLLRAMNRLSSMLYLLMIQEKAAQTE